MQRFLWRIAGADCSILERSGKESQYSFYVIGLLYVLIIGMTYIGFFGMFWGMFNSPGSDQSAFGHFLSAFIGSLVLSYLISNIYFLNLMSLEPKTLPVADETSSLWLTNIVRYTTVIMFAFFVSKNIEYVVFDFFNLIGVFDFEYHDGYMDNLIRLNKENPGTWVITCMIIALFIAPILLRQRLNKAHEYYMNRRITDKKIVIDHYENCQILREETLKQHYAEYRILSDRFFGKQAEHMLTTKDYRIKELKLKLQRMQFEKSPSKYMDEPFNTKVKKVELQYKSSEDFLKAILDQE